MKNIIGVLLLIALEVAPAEAVQDLRVVNGITVDLGPVHDLVTTRPRLRNERPMPHWKVLQLSEFKQQLANWDQCLVRNEDGQIVEILVAHLEPALRNSFVQLSQVKANIAAAQAQIYADEDRLVSLTPPQSIVVRRMRDGLESQIALERRQLRRLLASEVETAAECDKNNAFGFLATFSGRSYGDLPIWDCGQKK